MIRNCFHLVEATEDIWQVSLKSCLIPPPHQYLLAPPDSSLYVAMRDSRPAEEVYHEVSIVPHDRTAEEGCPLKAADSSCSKQPDAPAEEA